MSKQALTKEIKESLSDFLYNKADCDGVFIAYLFKDGDVQTVLSIAHHVSSKKKEKEFFDGIEKIVNIESKKRGE